MRMRSFQVCECGAPLHVSERETPKPEGAQVLLKTSAGKFHFEPPSHHSITSSAPGEQRRPPALALSGALLVWGDHGDADMHRVHDFAPHLSVQPIGELVQPLVQSAPKLNAGGN
jgi:hypothetical protein